MRENRSMPDRRQRSAPCEKRGEPGDERAQEQTGGDIKRDRVEEGEQGSARSRELAARGRIAQVDLDRSDEHSAREADRELLREDRNPSGSKSARAVAHAGTESKHGTTHFAKPFALTYRR